MLDSVKQAADAIAAKADAIPKSAARAGEALSGVAGDVTAQLTDATTQLKALSVSKVQEVLADLDAVAPLLREAGYVLEGVHIKVGLTPQIIANVSGGGTVSDERVDAMLAEHEGRALATLMVKAVRHATSLQQKLSIRGMRPDGMSVDVGIPPQVTIKFSPVAGNVTATDPPRAEAGT